MEGRAGAEKRDPLASFITFPSGVDFTVVRDSVILLDRKPLPRLHLTTGATALLECKVTIVLITHLFDHYFTLLKCGRVGLWQGV